MPAVSVVTPAYNVGPYLAPAIESVLAQTYGDLELLVVDDGSTDDTADIAADYARRDSRVKVLRQPNLGISAARNHALRAATGGVIAILDGDDIWLPQFVERQMGILGARPDVDIVTGNAWFLGSSLHGRTARPHPDARPVPTLARILEDEISVFIMSVFRRRVYEAIGGFDEAFRTNEDYDYWIRAAIAGFTFHRNDEPLGHYRRRDDSLSANEVRMLRGILRVLYKTRPALTDRTAERAILDAQVARFELELLAAEARSAIERGDFTAAGEHLAALHQRRGGLAVGVASWLARRAPALLSTAYNVRRVTLGYAAAPRRLA